MDNDKGVAVDGKVMTFQEQAIWNAAFGAGCAIGYVAPHALHFANEAVRRFRSL